jgi:putative ABC transport system permease protein
MARASRTPLAWLNLIQSAPRMAASLGGVSFAVVLMFLEMGFLNGLYDAQINVINKLNADLVIVNAQKQATAPKQPFAKRRLQQALAHPSVTEGYPIYVEELRAGYRNFTDNTCYPILVFGINPDDPVFNIPEVLEAQWQLRTVGSALVDQRSKPFYGKLEPGAEGELLNKRITIKGLFPLGADFRADGTMLVSERTFLRSFSIAESGRVDFGLLKLAPGADKYKVQAELTRTLPPDVSVLTIDELCSRVKTYWGASKPVGYVFGLGMFIGFVIGVMICYQILYTDVVDHLPQFATLKAIGYDNQFLINVVLEQATYLAIIGFIPGLAASWFLYGVLERSSGIPMILTPMRILSVFACTQVMCIVSGSIAIRRAVDLDPAEVF